MLPIHAENLKFFDRASLVDVGNFADLPDGVKALSNIDAPGKSPNGRLRRFIKGRGGARARPFLAENGIIVRSRIRAASALGTVAHNS